jgi:hypothetical protein
VNDSGAREALDKSMAPSRWPAVVDGLVLVEREELGIGVSTDTI